MQQTVKMMAVAELQALVARLGAREVKRVQGKVAYQGTGGVMLVAESQLDGRQRVLITQGSCVC